jgi:hypothetical protein
MRPTLDEQQQDEPVTIAEPPARVPGLMARMVASEEIRLRGME